MLRRNVLIFHQAALGDFVLTWPLAIALGRLHPQSRITYVAPAGKGKLAERVLGVDAQDAETGWPALFTADATVDETIAKRLAGTHAIFDFVAGAGSTWAANVARLAPHAEVTHLPTRPPTGYGGHVTDCLLESLATRPAVRTAVEQILRSVHGRGVATRRAIGQAVVLHPGSGSPAKNWPLDRHVELARTLRAAGREVRIVIGEVEKERCPAADIDRLRAVATDLRMPTEYLDLHRDLIDAAVYVGNDSGPTHLAAMCGVPTVALFLSTDPKAWSPVGPHVRVLDGNTAGVDDVIDAM